jgi:hypothetical protein
VVASFLRFADGERHVFRAAVVFIVLTLAVGPSASLLCKMRCHPREVATVVCHHHDDRATSSSVTNNNNTCSVVVDVSAFVREDFRRAVPAPHMQHAIAIRGYQSSPASNEARVMIAAAHERSVETRPLKSSLRI